MGLDVCREIQGSSSEHIARLPQEKGAPGSTTPDLQSVCVRVQGGCSGPSCFLFVCRTQVEPALEIQTVGSQQHRPGASRTRSGCWTHRTYVSKYL